VAVAKAEFKARNEGSYLGVLWYLLNPILTFMLLLFVFSKRVGQDIPYYPLYLLLGIIMYNLFQQTTTAAIRTMDDHRQLIKSVYFPRESLVLSNVLRTVFSHTLEVVIFIIISFYYKNTVEGIIAYIILVFFYALFIYGISLFLSALYLFFIDLENIWLFISRLVFFATPIFYAIEDQGMLFKANLLNPLYYFITIARDVLVYGSVTETWIIFGALAHSLLFFTLGSLAFNRLKPKFAEMV